MAQQRVSISSFAVDARVDSETCHPRLTDEKPAGKSDPTGAVHGCPGNGSFEQSCKRTERNRTG